MNIDSILADATLFSSEGIGKILADIGWAIYSFLFPANSDPATPVVVPR